MEKIYQIVWQGIPVTIKHKPKYFSTYDHIEVKAEQPLSITETGYRSIFTSEEEIMEYGGAVNLVRALLDEEATSSDWKAYSEESKQTSLF